ncbi:MAG: AMP-binding protein [Elusimicrobia bacterium]|nr:AMP-binding protein [Elusimicrobiota bacterium]
MKRGFLWGRLAALPKLDAAFAQRLCREAQALRPAALERPTYRVLRALDKTGSLWRGKSSRYRRQALRIMPGVSGFSRPMVERTLDILPELLKASSLEARLKAELGRADALDGWSLDAQSGRAVKAFPLGAVLHVAAGNIFLGCIDSVVMSLLTNNVTLLRMSSADPRFPLLFAESLLEADPRREVCSSLSIVTWDRAEKEVEDVFKRRLEGIVVWGGAEAVAAYREGLGAGCKLVEFGPKLSFGLLTAKGIARVGLEEAARRAARDVALWDQSACASPQTFFVQGDAARFASALAGALAAEARALPPGRRSQDSAADIQEHRHRALSAELLSRGRLLAPEGTGWTVALRAETELRPSPLGRFITVCPYRGPKELLAAIRPAAPYLQTAGLLAAPAEAPGYAEALGAAGAARVPELGRMLEGDAGDPHDGRYPLAELVRWVSGPRDAAQANAGKALPGLLERAREESSFYRSRAAKARGGRWPLVSKADLHRFSPPASMELLTEAASGSRVFFATGGSTGDPKYCLYTAEEFDETCRWLAWGLSRSGLAAGDVVANLFMAGGLWSSFLAVTSALRNLSVTHLPVGGMETPEAALAVVRRFRANVLIGLPSTLLELCRAPGTRPRVEKIFYGGEHVSPEMEREWRRKLGARVVRSAGYASVDAGLIGVQCAHCPGSVHHAAEGFQQVEIVPLEGRAGDGEIVVTSLLRRAMPVVRYRTGDLGRWTHGPCSCGMPSRRFELLGRCDDRLNIGGAHLDIGDVGRAVSSTAGLSLFYQAVADRARGSDRLTVRVERDGAATAESVGTLVERLSERLLACSAELRDSVKRGWLPAPRVEVLSRGGIPRIARTGKIRRVVDLRKS